MRPLSLALVVALAPALAAAQPAAVPTAADSALVERLLPRLQLDLAQEAMEALGHQMEHQLAGEDLGPFAEDFEAAIRRVFAFDLPAVTDSVRAAFYGDFRPDLIAEALQYLEGPTPGLLMAQSRFQLDGFNLGEVMGLLEDPAGQPLADSALAARYTAAILAASMPPAIQEITTRAVVETIPASLRRTLDEMLAPLGGFEGMLAQQTAQQNQAQAETMTLANRLALAPVDEAVVRDVTAFYASEAGRYIGGTVAVVFARLQAPAVAAMLRPMFEALAAQAKRTERPRAAGAKPNAPLVPPPPPAPAADLGEVYEVVDVQPELIGGLEGLQRRVAYPEAARRRGIEGQVVVQFIVDEGGRVVSPHALRSPDPLLSEAALAAVRGSRFEPGMQRGRPVKVRFAVPITFRLTTPEPEATDRGGW